METSVNQLLTRCIKFRNDVAKDNPSVFQLIEEDESSLQKILIPKIQQALGNASSSKLINIKLYLEERFSEHGPLSFMCSPNWTVWTVKQEIERCFPDINCPAKFQYIINSHRIAKDYDTLQDLGVTSAGSVLYVYVLQNSDQSETASEEDNDNLQPDIHFTSTELVTSHVNQLSFESESFNSDPGVNDTLQQSPGHSTVNKTPHGWKCLTCTFINLPTRPGCEMCSSPRPRDYQIPEHYVPSDAEVHRLEQEQHAEHMMNDRERKKKEKREQNYFTHMEAISHSIVLSNEAVECLICLTTTDPGDAVTLQECLHIFCKDCLQGHILASGDARVKCPYGDDNYVCGSHICDREVKALLTGEQFQCYLQRSLSSAEQLSTSSAHCKTPNCIGWCEYDDGVNIFMCPVCQAQNCLTCQAIHHPKNCKEYQDELKIKSSKDKTAKKTRAMLDHMLKSKEAIHCPQCNIIIMRKGGCDWVKCTMCKTEICWVTKGFRWGPDGNGDLSGGCHCKENGKQCHPDCVNCH